MIYKNKFGEVNILNPKYDFNNKVIGISMSGGADSTMLCYLLARTISEKRLNIIIQPYNGYDMDIPHDSEKVPNIIEYIRKKFPMVEIRWPIAVVYKTLDKEGKYDPSINSKNFYIRTLRDKLIECKVFDMLFIAITLGPSLEVQQKFKSLGENDIRRIKGYYLYNEVEEAEEDTAPFKNIDKRFILQCYKDFGMFRVLNEMTESCTEPDGKCGKCWWDLERKWAIEQVWM